MYGKTKNLQIGDPDHYHYRSGDDIRDRDEFDGFTDDVLDFIESEKTVTWRMLRERFKGKDYWLTFAIDWMDGKEVELNKFTIPERISFKAKKVKK
jgi:hypothetical protein